MEKILVPIDRSENSQQALKAAKKYAQKVDAKIVIVQVIEMYETMYNVAYATRLMPDGEVYKKESQEILAKAKSYFDDTEIEVETEVLWGSPADQILNYSEEGNFDLIIISTHGMTASKRFLLGSTTSKVVNHAKIPVLVLR